MRVLGKGSAKPLILVLLAAALLGGCVPKQYSDKQEKELVETCQPAIEKFLADRYGEYELGEFHLLKALIEPEKPLLGNYDRRSISTSPTPIPSAATPGFWFMTVRPGSFIPTNCWKCLWSRKRRGSWNI